MQKNYRRCGQQCRKTPEIRVLLHIVGNNADHFSALWATTLKNFGHCWQQHKIISTMRINIEKLNPHCKPLQEQYTQNKHTSQYP
jgi:hypothetical protein